VSLTERMAAGEHFHPESW